MPKGLQLVDRYLYMEIIKMTTVTVFQETRPAQLAEEVEPEQLEPTQGRHDSPGTAIAQVATDKTTAKSNAPAS